MGCMRDMDEVQANPQDLDFFRQRDLEQCRTISTLGAKIKRLQTRGIEDLQDEIKSLKERLKNNGRILITRDEKNFHTTLRIQIDDLTIHGPDWVKAKF